MVEKRWWRRDGGEEMVENRWWRRDGGEEMETSVRRGTRDRSRSFVYSLQLCQSSATVSLRKPRRDGHWWKGVALPRRARRTT